MREVRASTVVSPRPPPALSAVVVSVSYLLARSSLELRDCLAHGPLPSDSLRSLGSERGDSEGVCEGELEQGRGTVVSDSPVVPLARDETHRARTVASRGREAHSRSHYLQVGRLKVPVSCAQEGNRSCFS